ncbi:hypothetical protein VIGAN_05135900 [Vigna angularis var. angularis]|uniref:Uncharacterized protein n=1 Tax=Vigna angularis var. angularis TaxID=157739 RepID=A0A0S3S584_PHAAN|nr:hypothetical protein VIGAN_05135900 [Vigna angularis var. angularis]
MIWYQSSSIEGSVVSTLISCFFFFFLVILFPFLVVLSFSFCVFSLLPWQEYRTNNLFRVFSTTIQMRIQPLLWFHQSWILLTIIHESFNGYTLIAKNKVEFFLGTILQQSTTDPNFASWSRCNSMVDIERA